MPKRKTAYTKLGKHSKTLKNKTLLSSKKYEQAQFRRASKDTYVRYLNHTKKIPKGSAYFVDNHENILLGWHATHNPPRSMSGEALLHWSLPYGTADYGDGTHTYAVQPMHDRLKMEQRKRTAFLRKHLKRQRVPLQRLEKELHFYEWVDEQNRPITPQQVLENPSAFPAHFTQLQYN